MFGSAPCLVLPLFGSAFFLQFYPYLVPSLIQFFFFGFLSSSVILVPFCLLCCSPHVRFHPLFSSSPLRFIPLFSSSLVQIFSCSDLFLVNSALVQFCPCSVLPLLSSALVQFCPCSVLQLFNSALVNSALVQFCPC